MIDNFKRNISLILILGIIVNVIISYNVLENYDSYRERSDGKYENHMIRSDILHGWISADNVRQNLKNKKIFQALPINDRWYLPCILIGTYFYLIDEEIFENK